MLEIITGEASKWYKKRNKRQKNTKQMDKYENMKRFNYDHKVKIICMLSYILILRQCQKISTFQQKRHC